MTEELEKFCSDLTLIKETVNQLNKDLEIVSSKIIFSGNKNSAFNEITNQLCKIISSIRKKPSSLASLLYRVDISEKQLASITKNFSGNDFIFKLAETILYREFIKISIRLHYKTKTD